MSWPTGEQPFGPNHAPLLAGIASDGSKDSNGKYIVVPIAVDKASGALIAETSGGGGGGSTVNANIYYNQTISNSTAVQLSSTSHALTNGLIIQALSTNTASIFIGDSSVTTGNGFELQPGQATSVAVNNQNLPYVIGSNNTDKVCWIGN